jgi:hypothetical protein
MNLYSVGIFFIVTGGLWLLMAWHSFKYPYPWERRYEKRGGGHLWIRIVNARKGNFARDSQWTSIDCVVLIWSRTPDDWWFFSFHKKELLVRARLGDSGQVILQHPDRFFLACGVTPTEDQFLPLPDLSLMIRHMAKKEWAPSALKSAD